MDANENITVLREQAFTPEEIERLLQLCKALAAREALVVQRRLEFLRWLIQTGRINEQVV